MRSELDFSLGSRRVTWVSSAEVWNERVILIDPPSGLYVCCTPNYPVERCDRAEALGPWLMCECNIRRGYYFLLLAL